MFLPCFWQFLRDSLISVPDYISFHYAITPKKQEDWIECIVPVVICYHLGNKIILVS